VLSPQERALVTAQIEQVAREIAELNTPSLPAPSGRLGLKLIPRSLVANAARGLVEGAPGGGGGRKISPDRQFRGRFGRRLIGPQPADFRAVTKGRPLLRSVGGDLAKISPRPPPLSRN
jgi:hypothetical protein